MKPRAQSRRHSGFSLLEIVIACGLVLLLSFCGIHSQQTAWQRDREDRLRTTLLTVRTALTQFHSDHARFPATLLELLETPRPMGAFYLRRLPLNPMCAELRWEVSGQTSISGADDIWVEITAANTAIPAGRILDIRCPATAGDGLNGIPYHRW